MSDLTDLAARLRAHAQEGCSTCPDEDDLLAAADLAERAEKVKAGVKDAIALHDTNKIHHQTAFVRIERLMEVLTGEDD